LSTFWIGGIIPAKKNNKQVVRRGKGYDILPSKRHQAWHKKALPLLKAQGIPLHGDPVVISFYIWYPDHVRRDIDNTITTLMDLMVDAGILKDDNASIVQEVHGYLSGYDKDEPGAVVTIGKTKTEKGASDEQRE